MQMQVNSPQYVDTHFVKYTCCCYVAICTICTFVTASGTHIYGLRYVVIKTWLNVPKLGPNRPDAGSTRFGTVWYVSRDNVIVWIDGFFPELYWGLLDNMADISLVTFNFRLFFIYSTNCHSAEQAKSNCLNKLWVPLPWASVHWLVQCTLECHWNATGWPSVHWDTNGKT